MEINQIKIYGCKRFATINYTFNSNKTIYETALDIAKSNLKIGWRPLLVINGECCNDDQTIKFYQDKHPDSKFRILLSESTPKDLVYNFRFIQQKNNSYTPNIECVVCLDNKPNIANGNCYHDAILCSECVHQLVKCPFCFEELSMLERCN